MAEKKQSNFNERMRDAGRYIGPVGQVPNKKEELGPLERLAGTWSNDATVNGVPFRGFGWNLTALPLSTSDVRYRLMMNQYNEELVFKTADVGVPNRGLDPSEGATNTSGDQTVAALDYEQFIRQIAVRDSDIDDPQIIGGDKKPIHHEPGLFLWMKDKQHEDLKVARLGTIPHGNSVLAMGKVRETKGTPEFETADALPIGIPPGASFAICDGDDGTGRYLEPYCKFIRDPFIGEVAAPFPGFDPRDATDLLRNNPMVTGGLIKDSVVLEFDTRFGKDAGAGGIVNIPFVVREADATEMRSVFWLHELDAEGPDGNPAIVLQYLQIVMLEFFDRLDGQPGRIKWPHISINTMLRVSPEPRSTEETMQMMAS